MDDSCSPSPRDNPIPPASLPNHLTPLHANSAFPFPFPLSAFGRPPTEPIFKKTVQVFTVSIDLQAKIGIMYRRTVL